MHLSLILFFLFFFVVVVVDSYFYVLFLSGVIELGSVFVVFIGVARRGADIKAILPKFH